VLCCVATRKPFCFGFPEDGTMMLKHVAVLKVMYDFQSLYVRLLVAVINDVNRD